MADDRSSTPEKQLLKLIEESKGGRPKGKARSGPGFSFSAWRGALLGRLSFLGRLAKGKPAMPTRAPKLSLPLVNRLLAGVAIALFAYLTADVVASAITIGAPVHLAVQKEAASDGGSSGTASPLNESDYYLQKVAARDIFKEGGVPAKKDDSDEPAAAQDNAVMNSLSLVGISWSANPDVIIEDKDLKRTFFVKRGQTLANGVKVEAIFKDHVILSHDGQEFELR